MLTPEERVGGADEGDVAVPADVGAALEVVRAQAGLQLAVVVFGPPA